eukprot:Skav229804  [mRNA]  locus=scaffold567:270420:270665:+ [translate_table: standard]
MQSLLSLYMFLHQSFAPGDRAHGEGLVHGQRLTSRWHSVAQRGCVAVAVHRTSSSMRWWKRSKAPPDRFMVLGRVAKLRIL